MPIKFSCAKCQKAFTVADSAAGKQGRCKDCGHLNTIPEPKAVAPSRDLASSKASAVYEVTSAVNGAVFGPADQKTLRQWVREQRVTPDCKIKKVGTEKWLPANQLFPKLNQAGSIQTTPVAPSAEVRNPAAEPVPDAFANFKAAGSGNNAAVLPASTSANPYAAGTAVKKQLTASGDVVPTSGDIGFIIGHAFNVFKSNMGLMIGGMVLYVILAIVNTAVMQVFPFLMGEPGALLGAIINLFTGSFLGAGIVNLNLKAGRGEPAELADMFTVGDRVLPLVGFSLLAAILVVIPMFIMGILVGLGGGALGREGAMIAGVISFAAIFGLMMFAGLLLWPGYFLIVDRKTKIIEAFGVSMKIGRKNILQFIVLYIVAVLIFFAGILLLGIGVLISAPLALLVICCAYLNMSGQICE